MYYLITSISSGVILAIIGLFVLVKNHRNRSNILFWLFTTLYGANSLGAAAAYFIAEPKTAYIEWGFLALASVLAQSTFVFFTQAFIRIKNPNYLKISYAHLFIGLLVTAVTFFLPYSAEKKGMLWMIQPVFSIYVAYLSFTVFTFAFVFYLLWESYRQNRNTVIAEQTRYFSLAISIVFAAIFIDIAQQTIVTNFAHNLGLPITFNLAYLAAVVFAGVVATNIVKNKFLDIASALHHTLMWGILLALTFIPFSFGAHFIAELKFTSQFNRLTAFFGLVTLDILFFNWIKPRVDHLFFRRRYHLLKFLSEHQEKFSQISDLETITNHVDHILMNSIYPKRFSLVVDPRYFESVSGHLRVAIQFKSELLGYLVLQEKKNERPYNTTDRLFLKQLCNQLATALFIDMQKQEKVLLSEREKRAKELTYFISHEIKGPLYVIHGHIKKILEMPESSGPAVNRCLYVLKECAHLNQFLNNYLLFEKFNAGIETLEKTRFTLGEILDDVLERNQVLLEEKNISVRQKGLENLSVLADKENLRVVFNNLLSNAIKHSKKHGVIEVVATEEDSAIRLLFKDFGAGISDDMLQNLFLKFMHTSPHEGHSFSSGLGLFICHKIIERHQGVINVRSALNQGTEFEICVPKETIA